MVLCDNAPLHGHYQLEWDFRSRNTTLSAGASTRPSEVIAALGVVQESGPLLRR